VAARRCAEAKAREAALRIAGGARSKTAAVTARCSVVAGRRLSEGRAGNERDQRESGDKGFHDASPLIRTIVRGFLQQRQADGPCFAVSGELGPRDRRLNYIFGFAA
jgi:hypothetical protein